MPVAFAAARHGRETVSERVALRKVSLRPRLGVPADQLAAFGFPAASAFATFSVLGFYTALLPSLLTQSFRDGNHAHAGAGLHPPTPLCCPSSSFSEGWGT